MVFYLVVAIAGYFSTFNYTNPVVIERKPLSGDYDYWCLVGAAAVCVIMVASLPLNYHPWRY